MQNHAFEAVGQEWIARSRPHCQEIVRSHTFYEATRVGDYDPMFVDLDVHGAKAKVIAVDECVVNPCSPKTRNACTQETLYRS